MATLICILFLGLIGTTSGKLSTNETAAGIWVAELDSQLANAYTQYANASWIYNTNLTDYNLKLSVGIVVSILMKNAEK